ncbi:MAG: 2-hydroxy-3-oxopropionate reductase [Clostridia bacterium]|nr:2-hydroxy-3-oxopropionate reductase [Clostridia bacterium]
MKIGFIGLGIMGKPMCRNLLRAGYEVTVFNRSSGAMEELREDGALPGASSADVASKSDVVITMLPNSPDVKDVILGRNGVLEGARKGLIIIDMSSINPLASQEVCAEAEKRGCYMLDAPVSGGEPKAIDGTLAIMVGGKEEIFQKVEPILRAMGSSVRLCGGIGAGNTTKLANQVIVAANIAALSEALVLGRKAGVAPEIIFEAIRGGLAGSTVMNSKTPMMLDGDFDPGFRIALHIKDLANALDVGHGVGAPLPLTASVMEMMQWLRANGFDQEDHSSLIRYYENLAGTDIRRS